MRPDDHDDICKQARFIAFGNDGKGGKGADYNATGTDPYKATGLVGRCADIWRKALRFCMAIHSGKFDDKLREDALDLLNYCVMYVIVHDEQVIKKGKGRNNCETREF